MSRRRVALLLPSLAGGGAEHATARLLPALCDAFDLTLLLLEDRRAYALPVNLDVTAFDPPLPRPASHLLRAPRHAARLRAWVKEHRPDLILSCMEQANLLNQWVSRATGHRTLLGEKTTPRLQYANKGLLGRAIRFASRRAYPKADGVVCVSGGIREEIAQDYGIAPGRLHVIPNPVAPDELRHAATEEPPLPLPDRYVVQVGRLDARVKGQDMLLSMFARLLRDEPGLCLVLVGDGPDRAMLERKAESLGIDRQILFAGWQANVAPFLARAGVFVLTSRHEGCPSVLLEAMACGCPVVAADCHSGPREILQNGECGVLFPVDDEAALQASLLRVLRDSALREKLIRSATERLADFSADAVSSRYVTLIKQICEASVERR